MEQKTGNFYPSAPFENESKNDFQQRLERKLNEVNSFNNSIDNIKEWIT